MENNINKKLNKEWKNIIFNGIFAALTLLIVILFHKRIILATVLLIIIVAIGLIKWKSKLTLILFIFGGIFGAISEMIAINYGAWSYPINNVVNIPLWLFIVWGNTATFLYQTSIELKKIGIKDK